MRQTLAAAILLLLLALPVSAQRGGGGRVAVRSGGGIAVRSGGGMGVRAGVGVRPSGRIAVSGGVAFGRNPRVGIVIGARPLHHRHFFRPFYPYYPYTYPYAAYPYYGYGLESDFVYSGGTPYPYPQASYLPEHDTTGLQNQVYRLQAELDDIKQQQSLDQRYAAAPPQQQERQAAAPEKPSPPAVLVYRDGRKTEVTNYAVVGQTLWIFSEARARKVPLADLDLNATRNANEERGVEFNAHAPAPAPNR